MKGKNGTTSFLPERRKVEKLDLVRKSHTFQIKRERA